MTEAQLNPFKRQLDYHERIIRDEEKMREMAEASEAQLDYDEKMREMTRNIQNLLKKKR